MKNNKSINKVRAIILKGDYVLMLKQINNKNKVVWALPGGKCEYNNSFFMKHILKKKVFQKINSKIKVKDLVYCDGNLKCYLAQLKSSDLFINKNDIRNKSVVSYHWVHKDEVEYPMYKKAVSKAYEFIN